MLAKNTCLALYRTHRRAVDAFRTLMEAPVEHSAISVVGKPYSEWPVDCYDTLDRPRLLTQISDRDSWPSWTVVWVPGLGCLLSHGPIVADLLYEKGFSDASTALGLVLQRMGIPAGSILRYEMALLDHRSLVVAQGSRFEVEGVGELLGRSGALEVAIHAA